MLLIFSDPFGLLFVPKKAPDAIPRGLRGWGTRKDNMEISWEVRQPQQEAWGGKWNKEDPSPYVLM